MKPLLAFFGGQRLCDITADAVRAYQLRRAGSVGQKTVNLENQGPPNGPPHKQALVSNSLMISSRCPTINKVLEGHSLRIRRMRSSKSPLPNPSGKLPITQ
jgi:hypothetical protein